MALCPKQVARSSPIHCDASGFMEDSSFSFFNVPLIVGFCCGGLGVMARKHRISDIEHYGSSAMGRNKKEGFLMY